jgi:hypothetical protein
MIGKDHNPPRQWYEAKRFVQHGFTNVANEENKVHKQKLKDEKESLKTQQDARRVKYQSAQTYIKYCASVLADTCPTDEKVLILPFESTNQIYIEYVNYYKTFYGTVAQNMAGETTFSKALGDMHDTVRLAHAKGTELYTETIQFQCLTSYY